MQIETFVSRPCMKDLFYVLKYLKATCFSEDLSSYLIKKIILLETFQESMKQYEEFEWIMVKRALTETVLKHYFKHAIDLEKWDPEKDNFIPILERETAMVTKKQTPPMPWFEPFHHQPASMALNALNNPRVRSVANRLNVLRNF